MATHVTEIAMIEHQYSRSVAAAQHGSMIESIYCRIQAALLENNVPAPLKNLGLRYHVIDDIVHADLHGSRMRIRYDHVWLKDGLPIARLGGRMRFVEVTVDGKDGAELLQVVFDHLANARIGIEEGYFWSASEDAQELAVFVRQTSLALANAVHSRMAVLE